MVTNDIITPHNVNVFVGKLGDMLERAIDKPLGYAINWGRIWSLWPVHIETACCSVEFGAASGPRYDVERFGIIEAFGSLRQCDLVVVQGTITRKMAPRLRLVYDQMPEPKYVIAMGACAITGGLYFDSYNVLPGIDGVLPVDVYVPGCPPRPETLIQGCMLLQEKIKRHESQEVGLMSKVQTAQQDSHASMIAERFSDCVIQSEDARRPQVRVPSTHIIQAAEYARDMGYDHVESVTGVDYPEDSQIEVVYHLGSYTDDTLDGTILALATRAPREDTPSPGRDSTKLPSLRGIFYSVEFHEREIFEMLGVYFEGHPDNRRLLLPEDWADLPPLRKDFAIKGR